MIPNLGRFDRAKVEAKTWDAIVIGAGPSGTIAARQLARSGASVLLVEKTKFPRWKVCGACLNGQALAALESVGLDDLPRKLDAIRLEEFRVALNDRVTSIAMPSGVALSRARLDAALLDSARLAGADDVLETQAYLGGVQDGARLVRLVHQGESAHVFGRVVVAASGVGSIALDREVSGPKSHVVSGSRLGAGCVMDKATAYYHEGTIFMAVGRHGYVGLVRVEDGALNIAAAFDPGFVRTAGTLGKAATAILAEAGFPAVEGLENAGWRGTPELTRRTRPIAEERLFLIGDAAGYVEPFTGEGMAWALASANAVAPLARSGSLSWTSELADEWVRLHSRLIRRQQWVCQGLAAIMRRHWLADSAFRIAGMLPGVSRRVVQRLNTTAFLRDLETSRS